MKKNCSRLGVPEWTGIGMAIGVACGTAASLAGYEFDTAVPYCAGFGAVGVPVLWLGAGARLLRVIRRPRATRAVRTTSGLVA